MVYFSKIEERVFNLEQIVMISKNYVYLTNSELVYLSPKELEQLLADIDHAATLVRIQKESI